MSLPITETAILIPRRRASILTRPRLLDQLQGLLEHRLILLSAPPGYGKTALLVDFFYNRRIPVCWYTVDQTDNHLIAFLLHFLASIQHHFPNVGKTAGMVVNEADQNNFDLDQVIVPLVNDLQKLAVENLAIVLDDFHQIGSNERIAAFVSRFVQRAGDNIHMILSARKNPVLPDMELMAGRSQLGFMKPTDLLFTIPEIQALFWQNHRLVVPDEKAGHIHHATGGWITTLLLSPPEHWEDVLEHTQAVNIGGFGLYDYLSCQILAQQSQETQSFLLFSSLLGDFDIDLCRSVLGSTVYSQDTNWDNLLATVTGEYMLAQQMGEQGERLRYNQPFEEFLQKQAFAEYPEQARQVLEKLAATCEEQDTCEKAWWVYRKLGDQERQASLIEKAGPALIKQGRFRTLARWLGELPADMVYTRPHLLSIQGVVMAMSQDLDRAMPLLNKAVELFEQEGSSAGLALALARRATAFFSQGNHQASLADAERVIELTQGQPGQESILADALTSKGIGLTWSGKPEQGLEYLEQSFEIYGIQGDVLNCVIVRQEMGIAYRIIGNYRLARESYQQALAIWNKIGDVHKAASVYNNLGVLDYYDGDYAGAAENFQASLNLAKQSGYSRMEGYALVGLGDVFTELGANARAHAVYTLAANIPATANSILIFYTHIGRARLFRLQRDWPSADAMMQAARLSLEKYPSLHEQGIYTIEAGLQALGRKKAEEATAIFEEAVGILNEAKKVGDLAQAFLLLASAQHAVGHPGVKENLWKAFEKASLIQSRHVLVIPGQHCKPLLETFRQDVDLKNQVALLASTVEQFEDQKPSLLQSIRQFIQVFPGEPVHLLIKGFGDGLVYLDGRLISNSDWTYVMAKEVLFYLLSNPRGLSQADASLHFWQDSDPKQRSAALRNTRYYLRRALGQDILAPAEDRLVFNFGLAYQYDVEDFQRLIRQAKVNPEEAAEMLEQAINLYANDFLHTTWRDWAAPIRTHLRQELISALLDAGEIALSRRNFERGLEYCRMALQYDVTLEAGYRLSMRIYAALGQRAEAVKQYHLCRQALQDHLGIAPDAETEELFKRLT